jgi:Flp pilus assembly protein TadB
MNQIIQIIKRKPFFFLLASIGYLLVAGFIKWTISPPVSALWYLIGGVVGIYFLDFAEAFFKLSPSPFRTIVFAVGFAMVSLFVVTSSGSLLATGLVLSLYLTIILWQLGERQIKGNLSEWYRMIAGPVDSRTQNWILIGFIVLFFIETYSFVR